MAFCGKLQTTLSVDVFQGRGYIRQAYAVTDSVQQGCSACQIATALHLSVPTVKAQEWLRVWGPGEWTQAPNGQQEADVHELGRHVAQQFGYQAAMWDDEVLCG